MSNEPITWEQYHDLGTMVANGSKDFDLARKLYAKALQEIPPCNDETAFKITTNVAVCNAKQRVNLDDAIKIFEAAVAKDPGVVQNYVNLSYAQLRNKQIQETIETCKKGLQVAKNADLYSHLALAYGLMGNYHEEFFNSALSVAIDPSREYQLAMVAMKWKAVPSPECWKTFSQMYASRKKPVSGAALKPPPISDESVGYGAGKKIVIAAEQGLGDLIMMAPAVKWLERIGYDPILFSNDDIVVDFASRVLDLKSTSKPFTTSQVDYCINLMDLLEWKDEWSGSTDFFKPWIATYPGVEMPRTPTIGVNFTGNPDFEFEYIRGIYDEQVRDRIIETVNKDAMYRAVNLANYRGGSLSNFRGILSGMSKIITTDTMTAHMAGAMGIPCLVLLAPNYDWRWYHEWYGPTFKTAECSLDWSDATEHVKDFLND